MEHITLTGPKPGPRLVVLGGVHGNEPCGPKAIAQALENLTLDCGTLVCVPRVNELALERDVRFVDANLNRVMGAPDPATHEGRLVPTLRALLEGADYLLDLHSYTAGGPPFAFGETDAATMAFARSLPAHAIITGWADCYRKTHPDQPAPGIGTTEYARDHGCIAVTFECGQHRDPEAPAHGLTAIRAALAHTGLVSTPAPLPARPRHIAMDYMFVKDRPGRHAQNWQHLQPIAKGEVFAVMDDGSVQTAPFDGVLILPYPNAGIGIEWGYLGVER